MPLSTVHNCCNKDIRRCSNMSYMISSQSVIDGVSLSVIKSKLVNTSMIFVDNKLYCLVICH